MFCYSDTPAPFTGKIDLSRMDPVKQYLKHYSNFLYLSFIHARGTTQEKFQAAKELKICDRKLKYWQRQPNWSAERASTEIQSLKRQWS